VVWQASSQYLVPVSLSCNENNLFSMIPGNF
jgi:hypothetical protein